MSAYYFKKLTIDRRRFLWEKEIKFIAKGGSMQEPIEIQIERATWPVFRRKEKRWNVAIMFRYPTARRLIREFMESLTRLGPIGQKREEFWARFYVKAHFLTPSRKILIIVLSPIDTRNKYYEKKLEALILKLLSVT